MEIAITTASAGRLAAVGARDAVLKRQIGESIDRLAEWLERRHYRGYDTFDGLNARFVRPLTFNNKFLLIALQQGVRRFPINLRPLLGVRPDYSSKGMGFLARGFIRMHEATGDDVWLKKAAFALDWLGRNRCQGYAGACWGNHFDYQSRVFDLPKGVPTVVWTALIGHAFLDGYDHLGDEKLLRVAESACEHILHDLDTLAVGETACISYIPTQNKQVHNANTLGASLLARTFSHTHNDAYRTLARKAIAYTASHQRADGSWYYGEASNLHWVDNFHTAYVLDCFKHYADSTGDRSFHADTMKGYHYWKDTFFLADGTPRYYDRKTLPIDIQCCSQAIDTLTFFNDYDPESLSLACAVARWTMAHMQDDSGYFYYRRYSPLIVNKTPMLHWGQATMMCALAGLYKAL